jgi:molybdenum cofactor synthesis domain-containing protein
MKPFKSLTSREAALELIIENSHPTKQNEEIPLVEGIGRVLAKKAVAKFNVPPFERSSMDGYAVRAKDTFGAGTFSPKKLKLIGEQHAGESFEGKIGEEECLQIATGSPVPKGSDAVVMVEFTNRDGDLIDIQKPVYPGANISPIGEDIKVGDIVILAGETLTPAKIGALAALNMKIINVYKKPEIAIYSTGSEVRPLGTKLKSGQIYDINQYTLSAIIEMNGCAPIMKGIIPDNKKSLETAIKEGAEYDMAVFSGGSSVGVRDFFTESMKKLGEVFFHGVQIKPGKPTLFGLVDGTPIFGMPGYPTSCLSNSYIFLKPSVRRLARLAPPEPKLVKARMGARFVSSSGREQFLTVKIIDGVAHPVFKKSGAITSMADADGYIVLPVNLDVIEENEEVTVTVL